MPWAHLTRAGVRDPSTCTAALICGYLPPIGLRYANVRRADAPFAGVRCRSPCPGRVPRTFLSHSELFGAIDPFPCICG